jgi:hypothetical protein
MLPTNPAPRTRATTEHDEQKKLIHIIRNELAPKYPILRWLYSVPNGLRLHPAITTQMINEGAKAGIPDLFLPVRSGKYSGLYIEMKSAKGKLSEQQKDFKIFVESQGFKVVVPRSCHEALNEISHYCRIELDHESISAIRPYC